MEGTKEILASLLPIAFFIAIFYFLLIRPQNKQRKQHKEMITNLKKGDKVITTGGLIVEIIKPEDTFFNVKLGDGVNAKLSREFISYKLGDENETSKDTKESTKDTETKPSRKSKKTESTKE